MANNKLTTRIVLRNDTTGNWLASNDVTQDKLLKGEIGIEFVTDLEGNYTGKVRMKIGDGEKSWNDLPYFGGDECHVFETEVAAGADHKTAIVTAVGTTTLNKGDIAIVKEAIIAEADLTQTDVQKYQYTAYVYGETTDGTSDWKAMDGNYSAENVYFPEDMLVTKEVGYITLTNGQAYIPSKGKNLTQVFEAMYVKEANPSTTQPSVSLDYNDSDKDGHKTTSGSYEVGEKVTPTWDANFSAGSYTYGPATGVTVTSWEISDTNTNTASTATGSFPELQITDDTSYYITAKANYTAGAIPVTNKGNNYPAGQISAGSKSANSSGNKITGYRKMFYGAFTTPIDTNGASIRTNCTGAKHGNFKITVPDGCKQVVIALYGKTLKNVYDKEAFGTDIYSGTTFKLVSATTSIPGANDYTGVNYNIYVYTPDTALGANEYTCNIG